MNKIHLIKRLRDMCRDDKVIRYDHDPDAGTHSFTVHKVPDGPCKIGLKDAKDFVEECMAFGVERYLRDELGKRGIAIPPEQQ